MAKMRALTTRGDEVMQEPYSQVRFSAPGGRTCLDAAAHQPAAHIGAKRKRALLSHFGSAEGVRQAGLQDLERVPGISRAVARTIHDHFHESG